MRNIREKIIEYIRTNRVSTTEVADCLGKTGVLDDVAAVNRGMFAAGTVRYVYGYSESNWSIHEQVRFVEPGEIVVIDGIDVGKRALIGELVTKFILYYRGAAAIVTLGAMRDANDLIKNRYSVWCKGFTPVGCFNKEKPQSDAIRKIVEERRSFYDGAVAVCDDSGVVLIPGTRIADEFLEKLEQIERQEDIWFNCIDFQKWDTFDTVCKKKYLNGQ